MIKIILLLILLWPSLSYAEFCAERGWNVGFSVGVNDDTGTASNGTTPSAKVLITPRTAVTVTSITVGAGQTDDVTTGSAHYLSAGDRVYLDAISTTPQINDTYETVLSVSSATVFRTTTDITAVADGVGTLDHIVKTLTVRGTSVDGAAGWRGGTYSIPASEHYGTHDLFFSVTVPTNKVPAKVIDRIVVSATCPELRPQIAGRTFVVSASGAGDAQVKGMDAGVITSTVFTQGAADLVWSSATRTLTLYSDSSGVTTLLTRVPSVLNITAGRVGLNLDDTSGTLQAAEIAEGAIGLSQTCDIKATVTAACTATATSFCTNRTEATNSFAGGIKAYITALTGTASNSSAEVSAYSSTNGQFTLTSPGLRAAPATNDTLCIIEK